jgi:DNA-binding response OmpR family regulator
MNILVIESPQEPRILQMKWLGEKAQKLFAVASAEQALALSEHKLVEFVIFDLDLYEHPDPQWIRILRKALPSAKIIALSRAYEHNSSIRLLAYENGSDFCLPSPAEADALLALVNMMEKQTKANNPVPETPAPEVAEPNFAALAGQTNPLKIDSRKLSIIGPMGRQRLTMWEFRLINEFLYAKGQFLDYETIQSIQGGGPSSTQALHSAMYRLRKKMMLIGASDRVLSVWSGRGYYLHHAWEYVDSATPEMEQRLVAQ